MARFNRTIENMEQAREQMQQYVEEGKARAGAAVRRVFEEAPQDMIARATSLYYTPTDAGAKEAIDVAVRVQGLGVHTYGGESRRFGLHDNALQQVTGRYGLPLAYVRELQASGWGKQLIAHNLNTLGAHTYGVEDRFLLRTVGPEVRGFVSSKYRRIDSRPILDALIGEVQGLGGIVTDGHAADVRTQIRFLYPEVFEPLSGEFVVFGGAWENSDYGRGAHELSTFVLRLACLNGAKMQDVLRQVHLGARLGESIEFSQATYELDTRTVVSAVKDVVRTVFSRDAFERTQKAIQQAGVANVDVTQALAQMRNRLSKEERESIAQAYNGPDVVMLPQGNTAWRFSNAISFVAGNTEDQVRRMELESIAGEVIPEAA